MQLLSRSASGLRHLRWAREVGATLLVHHEHNPRIAGADRDLMLAEAVCLGSAVNAASAAVKSYRDFLERERTRFRGMQRVGHFLVKTSQSPDDRSEAAAIDEGFAQAAEAMEARERRPRKQAVRAAIEGLRQALLEMNDRIEARLGTAFVDSLYPKLSQDGAAIRDDPDEDDDATTDG